MIKFVHISDFHLNNTTLNDWNDFIKKPFIKLLKDNFEEYPPVIICTGDLLDKGGVDFERIEKGFNIFKQQIIMPIIEELNIPIYHFICIPGNHDIDRCADNKIEQLGLVQLLLEGEKSVHQYVENLSISNPKSSKRVLAYKHFENNLYGNNNNVKLSYLGSTFVLNINGFSIGVAGFNSVWNCINDADRKNGIYISESQYNQCKSDIEQCDLKIALLHHPLDWLEKESNTIQCWIRNDYDILLCGHVHMSDTSVTTKIYGSLFIDKAPSFENDIRGGIGGAFANGVNIIEVDDEKTIISLNEYKYNHSTRSYVSEKSFNFNFISYNTQEEKVIDKCIKFIRTAHYPEFDNSIIPHKAAAIKTLREAFVLPPIEKNGQDSNVKYNMKQILNDNANIVLFGSSESGKTTLLYRMVMEIIDNHSFYQTIPVYVDFNNIGNKDIETCIKSYLDCNSEELKILLKNSLITLFLDNYTPNSATKHTCNRLYQFTKENCIRIIATHNSDLYYDTLFVSNNQIAFETYHIRHFNAENVRQLMLKWSPDVKFEEANSKLQNMVSNFCSYSLPCSAMSVSLYLWSTENTDKKPVNPALLLDIFLEIILERINPDYLYRDSFDYDNKIMLLAHIAKFMCLKQEENIEYKLTYAQYVLCITDYLKNKVGFEKVEADKIGEYFLSQKVLTKHGNYVDFSHTCFYYFLLAKRMISDYSFKKYILSEEQYYKYERVIDYYAGLNRSDEQLLSDLLERFNKYFSPIDDFREDINRDMDNCFTYITTEQVSFTPKIKKMNINSVIVKKGQQEDVEKRVNELFDKKLSRIADRYTQPNILYPDLMIILLSKALRNLDGVENITLKTQAYTSLIKNSLSYTFILKNSLAKYANEHSGSLPSIYSNVKNVPTFFKFMPYSLQCSIHEIMGTTKLFTPIKNKILEDKSNNQISDIEKYFSIAMLWDSTGLDNEKEIKQFIKKVKNNCVQDFLFQKLYSHFMNLISVNSEEEEKCISLLAELKVKGEGLKSIRKGQVMSKFKQERDNFKRAKNVVK